MFYGEAIDRQEQDRISAEASAAYLANHPEPVVTDVHCGACGATPGEFCAQSRALDPSYDPGLNSHTRRWVALARAKNLRAMAARDAGREAVDEAFRAVPNARRNIYTEARDAYKAAHPEPKDTDVPCRKCGAEVGSPCLWGPARVPEAGISHKSRAAQMIRARERWSLAANEAGHRAVDRAERAAQAAG